MSTSGSRRAFRITTGIFPEQAPERWFASLKDAFEAGTECGVGFFWVFEYEEETFLSKWERLGGWRRKHGADTALRRALFKDGLTSTAVNGASNLEASR